MNKSDMEFWIFPLNSRDLYQFYSVHKDDSSLHYALYIRKCAQNISGEIGKVLRLRNDSVLLIDSYLVPLFYRLNLSGYAIIIAEAFCVSNEHKALLKLSFSHVLPEGIIDIGYLGAEQKKCMDLIYLEYCSRYDVQQAWILRNLLANVVILSPTVNYEGQFKSGHLSNYALQFMDLIDEYAFKEKKINFYAEQIGITEKTLREALRFIYYRTFKEILTSHILVEAIRLLVFSNKNITQIANELGYDVSNFVKFFSQQKGMHPKDLRINYRKIINEINNGN
jgi:AraC-like DNA-binding protein